MRRTPITPLALITLATLATASLGATDYCPTPGGTLGTPVVVDSWHDQKGGTWTLTCTNASPSGDFVWTYTGAAPGSPTKVIGRCVYVGGQNSTGVVPGPTGNDDYWWHTCLDPNPVEPGKYRAIIDIFNKNECTHSRRYMLYCDGVWMEEDRRDTSAEDFESQAPDDDDGDSIPDEGKRYLTEDLYGPGEPPPLPADYETRVTIEPEFIGPETMLLWDPGVGPHSVAPGDIIRLEGLDITALTWLDPRFIAVPASIGIELHPLELVPLTPDPFVIIAPPEPLEIRYSVGNPLDFNFVNNAFHSPLPLHALGFSFNLDFSDAAPYGLTSGSLFAGPVVPPCPGDATGDNIVDFDDLNLVLANWNTPGPDGDVDGSGFVDFDDLNLVLNNWGANCAPASK